LQNYNRPKCQAKKQARQKKKSAIENQLPSPKH